MTVSTFFPDGDTESTSVDGHSDYVDLAGQVWDTIHDQATGTSTGDDDATVAVVIRADADTDEWDQFQRGFFLFDTSALPDNDNVDSATFEFVLTGTLDDDMGLSLALVLTTPASNVAITTADYDQTGAVDQATQVTLASLTNDGATFNVITLNSTGLGNISKTSITKFGIVIDADSEDVEPTWFAGNRALVEIASADEGLAGDKRPKLVVTHSAVPDVFAGLWAAMNLSQPILIPTGMRAY